MSNVYTIYAYFNSEQIQGVLNAVVMLVGSGGVDGDYLSIVRVAAMLGMFMAMAYGFLRARGEDAAHYLLMVAIFYSVLFVPRVTVTIEEHGGAGGGAPIVVDNVPLGLAFFASTTSHIGYWLTEKTETFFSLPDTSLRMSSHGLMGGARALRLSQSAAMPDPVLAQDMINFMRECINPELVVSPTLVNSLMTSTNIWDDLGPSGLGVLNPGRMVTLAGATGAMQCDDAYTNILGPRLAPAATSEFTRIAQMLSPNAPTATAQTMLASLLPAAEGLIMTASASTTGAIRQRMMLNMLNDTSANMAQVMNNPAAAQTALGAAMAASSANTSYSVMARLAQETLPLIRNSIELVVIGVFPIVLILIIVAGSKGGLVLRSYVMTMLWVQLWAPLYAIVNYVTTMAGAKSMKASLAGVDGVSVTNAAQLLNTTISAEAIAGMLTIAVPMIALAIVKGGEVAMAGVTSGLTGPADRAASKAGDQVGTGNVSMGNASWGNGSFNNTQGNKTNMAFGHVTPNRGDMSTEFGSMTMRGGQTGTAGQIGNLQPEFGNIGVSGSHGSKVEAANTGQSGQRADFTTGAQTGLQQGTSGQFTHQQGAAAAAKIQKTMENTMGGDWSWMTKDGAGGSFSNTDRTSAQTGTGHTSNLELGGRAGFNAGGNVVADNPAHRSGQLPSGAPASNAPPTANLQQPGSTGNVPVGAPAAAAGTPAAAGGTPAANTSDKAQRAAKQLGQAPSRSSYGVTGSYGFAAKDSENKSWTGDRSDSSEVQQRAEKNFESASRAINSLVGKTASSGERAAMESFLGSLSTATNATYGTNTSSGLTQTAADTNQRTSGTGASYQVNDNARYAAAALEAAGGNGARALQEAVTNPQFLDQAGTSVGQQVANQVAPSGGTATGMDGAPIAPPKSVDQQKREGDSAVEQQRPADTAAATAAGQANMSNAVGRRASMGAPNTTAMPSLQSAEVAHEGTRSAAESGREKQHDDAAVGGGTTRAAEAIFADKAGMGRLLDASLGGGFFGQAKTADEIRQPLQELAQGDPEARERLAAMGKTGRATKEDIEFLAGRASAMNAKNETSHNNDYQPNTPDEFGWRR